MAPQQDSTHDAGPQSHAHSRSHSQVQRQAQPQPPTSRGQVIIVIAAVIAVFAITGIAVANAAVVSVVEQQTGIEKPTVESAATLGAVDRNLQATVERINADPDLTTATDRRTAATTQLPAGIADSDAHTSSDATVVTGSLVAQNGQSVTMGQRIVQNDLTSNYTSGDGSADYTVISGATTTRAVTATIDANDVDSLPVTDSPGADRVLEFTLTGNTPNGVITETVQLYRDTSTGVTLRYDAAGSNTQLTCSPSVGAFATVNLVTGQLNQHSCESYPTFTTLTDVSITNGDVANGTFAAVTFQAGPDPSNPAVQSLSRPPESGTQSSPGAYPAVYGAVVEMTIATADGQLSRTIIIAPGAPAGDFRP